MPAPAEAARRSREAATLAELASRPAPVDSGEAVDADVALAASSYQRFLAIPDADPALRAIVLGGHGKAFCAGADLSWMRSMADYSWDQNRADAQALADLKPAINVVGLIPACENLINGRAVKPGDVVTSMSGQTIEILNTDAEGRLVLCDALTYAERFKPRAVVDIATLTGACVIALGAVRSGMFSPSEDMAAALLAAGILVR